MLTTQETIARYYVGYYNRAPDPAGFAFWTENLENGVSTLEIANFFADQDETRALYPYFRAPDSNTPDDFIRSIYQNLFNREPDAEGFQFWIDALTSGNVNTGQMIEAIIDGATTNPDLSVVQNKVESAIYWEDQANNFEGFSYADAAVASANDALANVTDDTASVDAAQARSNSFFSQLTEDKGDPGDNLTNDGSTDDKVGIANVGLSDGGGVSISSATSDPVLNLDGFRNDARFAGIDGSGQTVVVIDTGIDLDHPAFGPDSDGNGVSDRIIFARDFTNEGDGTANDEQGHGSNVASIVASSNPNYTGVAPGANIVALQALDRTGVGNTFGIEDALQWVVQNAEALNIVAVNMSLGDSSNNNAISTHPVYGDELSVLTNTLGVTTIVAAGNSYTEFQSEGASTLSVDPNTVSIGAVGGSAFSGGDITSFSQRSDDVPTIFAPGSFIEGAAPGGGSSESSGTSQAAPHVAGMVALAQQLAQQELGRSLTPREFATLLQQSGDTFVDDNNPDDRVINTGNTYTRADMLDLAEAILAIGDGGSPAPGPTPDPTPTPGDDIAGTIDTAARIEVGTAQSSSIDFGGDEDFFAVSLTPGAYEISLTGAASGGGTLSDPFLTLLSSGGSFLTSNDDGGAGLNSLIEFVVSQEGTYFINASAFGSALGSYTLDVVRTGGSTGDVGETPDSAGSLAPGGSVNSALDFGGDRDLFAIELSTGQTYTFDMVGGTLADPFLVLFDSSGQAVAGDDDSGDGLNASLTFEANSTGTLFLGAAAFSNSQTGTYTLSVTGQGSATDDFADNTSTAGSIFGPEGAVLGRLEVAGDRDWFRVELDAGASYEFALVGADTGNALSDPVLYLYDSAGNLLGLDDDGGNGLTSLLSFDASASGTYYLGAAAYSDGLEGEYVLTSTLTGTSSGDVAGDTSTTASLAPGQTLQGVLDVPGDTDWYGINIEAGQSYLVTMTAAGSNPMSDPYLVLLDGQGNFIGENDDASGLNAAIEFDALQSGRVYISAEAFNLETDAGTYELNLTPLGSTFNAFSTSASTALLDYDYLF